MSTDSTLSFDRMRSMLMRAAEIRDSEQQQIFDSLDEIHARLAALDALGTVRKRLTELPDRNEVGVLAERLDEAVAKLDAQDAVLASVARAVEALPDRLAMPFAQLDGRLDGMAGRVEGVSGRMEGLDDRLAGLHKRLDDLDNRLDRNELRLDAVPGAVGSPVKEHLDTAKVELLRRLEELAARPAVDPSEPLDALAARLDAVTSRLDGIATRLDAVDAGLSDRPDTVAVADLVDRANTESERRSAGRLDEAMATFAELILGRGAAVAAPPPRPAQRRSARKAPATTSNGTAGTVTDDPDA